MAQRPPRPELGPGGIVTEGTWRGARETYYQGGAGGSHELFVFARVGVILICNQENTFNRSFGRPREHQTPCMSYSRGQQTRRE
jgi:hypothetical protein